MRTVEGRQKRASVPPVFFAVGTIDSAESAAAIPSFFCSLLCQADPLDPRRHGHHCARTGLDLAHSSRSCTASGLVPFASGGDQYDAETGGGALPRDGVFYRGVTVPT